MECVDGEDKPDITATVINYRPRKDDSEARLSRLDVKDQSEIKEY